MKKSIQSSKLILIASFFLLLAACTKDAAEPFVKRSTDELNFDYKASSQTFTVRSNGGWSVVSEGNDWITLDPASGTGDGETMEVITVNVHRNYGEQREANVVILAGGQELMISVSQKNGTLILGDPFLKGSMNVGSELEDVFLNIPYTRGAVDDEFDVSISIDGEGGNGINNVVNLPITLSAEEGNIEIPLSGLPTKIGTVKFSVSSSIGFNASFSAVTLDENAVPLGTVYFEENFDKMQWGGDYVNSQSGIKGAFIKDEDGKLIIDTSQPVGVSTDGTDGSNDLIAGMAESYRESRGFSGWDGLRIYERPGYIKISTAGSSDGHVVTPALSSIGSETVNVKVSLDMATWSTSSDNVYIEVLNAGVASVEFIEVTNAKSWANKAFFITGATAETKIKFLADKTMQGRFFIDNIVVEKSN